MSIIWSLIIILLFILEYTTVNIIAMWYGLGACISLVLTLFNNRYDDNFGVQFLIWVFVGTILLIVLRKKTIKYLKNKELIVDVTNLVGQEGVVVKEITPRQNGEVRIKRKTWTAYAKKRLKVGDIIKVVDLDGVKLKVRKKS